MLSRMGLTCAARSSAFCLQSTARWLKRIGTRLNAARVAGLKARCSPASLPTAARSAKAQRDRPRRGRAREAEAVTLFDADPAALAALFPRVETGGDEVGNSVVAGAGFEPFPVFRSRGE